MSDDEGLEDDYAFQEFTEEELAQIDPFPGAASASTYVEQNRADDNQKDSASTTIAVGPKSPQAEFKKNHSLSVSDLTNPAWCEVQYDYRLRHGRSLPPEKRPDKFESSKGKVIAVQLEVTLRQDKMTKEGQAVHKKLERAVHPEVLRVKTNTQEERWALRFVDTVSRLQCLKSSQICREMWVWGIMHDEPMIGIIDELRLLRNKAGKDGRFTVFDRLPSSASSTNFPTLLVQIRDNKTRGSHTVPPHADTLPSRLQLMLYHHLFHWLISATSESLIDFWTRISLDVDYPFSEEFIGELKSMAIENNLDLNFLDSQCLRDLIVPYHRTLYWLQSVALSDRLSLVYRRRKSMKLAVERSGSGPSSPIFCSHTAPIAEPQLSADDRTETESKQFVTDNSEMTGIDSQDDMSKVSDADLPLETPETDGTNLDEEPPPHSEIPAMKYKTVQNAQEKRNVFTELMQSAIRRKLNVDKKRRNSEKSISESETADDEDSSGKLIGTKTFYHREAELNEYVADILLWWKGERPPRGVSIENSNRCNSCEYREGCEWREEKALEFLSRASFKQED